MIVHVSLNPRLLQSRRSTAAPRSSLRGAGPLLGALELALAQALVEPGKGPGVVSWAGRPTALLVLVSFDDGDGVFLDP